MRHIGYFPEEIATAARNYDPARITRYVTELATLFHKFYTTCRSRASSMRCSRPGWPSVWRQRTPSPAA